MKTTSFLFTFLVLTNFSLWAQVGIGGNPDASAQLDVQATDKGLLLPRVSLNDVTNQQLDGTNNATEGLVIYNTNANVNGGDGKGFYYFNGTQWTKMVAQPDNISIISLDTNQVTITNTSGADVPGYDTALEPIFFNPNGLLEVKLIVRYSAIQGTVNFQLRAHDNSTEKWPIVNSDFGIFATTQTGGVATSNWKAYDFGTNAHEIHLFAWLNPNSNGDFVTIESAYLLVRSQ